MDDKNWTKLHALAAAAVAAQDEEAWPGHEAIRREYRCPSCGSSDVRKITAIIDSANRTVEAEGKKVPFKLGNNLLHRWDPGPKPRAELELVAMTMLLLLLSLMLGRLFGFIPFMLPWAGVAGLMLLYWERRKNLGARLKAWMEQRIFVARGWHCRQCGEDYLPSAVAEPGVIEGNDEPPSVAPGNVNPLHKG